MKHKSQKYAIVLFLSLLFAALLAQTPKSKILRSFSEGEPLNPKPLNSKLLNSKLLTPKPLNSERDISLKTGERYFAPTEEFYNPADLLSSTSLNETPQVLFIGNSYFNYNNQPAMFKALCDSMGRSTVIGTYVKNGTSLKDNTQDQNCLDKIASREWDYVIGIDAGPGVAYPQQYSDRMSYLAALSMRNLTHDANDSGRFIWVMPWAFEDGMLWLGWEDDYSRMQQKIYVNSLNWARGQDYTVAPVGWAWAYALDSLDFPLHYLHASDWNHPSYKGSYLMACVLYCTVFQDTLSQNTFIGDLSQDEAFWYQELATEIVLENPELWYLPNLETSISLPLSIPRTLTLDCYPNPFNPNIKIDLTFSVPSAQGSNTVPGTQHTALKIYDLQGKLLKTLHEGYLDAIEQTFYWDASDVPAGVYVVQAQAGREVRTKKIVYLP